jgi:hypothetical protein
MRSINCTPFGVWLAALLAAAGLVLTAAKSPAVEIVLKDGRALHGEKAQTASLADISGAAHKRGKGDDSGAPDPGMMQLIVFLDDNLRRTYFSERLVREVRPEENRPIDEKFAIRQRVQRTGPEVRGVGQPVQVSPFDEFGRRKFSINTARGIVNVVQGITELTPQWTKVSGLNYLWDMRIATSSIPRDTLHKILLKQTNPKSVEDFKKIARFYLQCERYAEARAVLDGLLKAMPDQSDLKEQLAPSLRAIRQLSAQQLLRELKLRHDAGQHRLVWNGLKQFPSEQVGGETLQAVRDMLQDYEARLARCRDVGKQLKALAARIPDTIARENLKPILDEIAAEISFNTVDRMAAFLQSADDKQTDDAEKLALAISGWLLGADAATPKLPTAISAYKVRGLILEYFQAASAPDRQRAYSYIKQEPGGDPAVVAELLAHMKPPVAAPEPTADKPGYFELQITALPKEPPATYYIQLPPEYDPYRRYPTVVTLNGVATPQGQVDWWAGEWGKAGTRTGQATRHGYIVIAPAWRVEHQKQYNYSAREHAVVLNSLRDACRRFSIDTDRVYLSGQSIGGDAAWDIGLAHPDLWAGVIPIVAQSDRYCTHYWENARYVPFYVVAGGLDGLKLINNARDLDRCLRRGFDCTVVEFLGRGHEDFYDEILRIFDWMGRFHRNFFPREFACKTMRSWDNFFWWVELQGLPPRSLVDPADWPPPSGTQPAQVKARITEKNGLTVQIGTTQVTVWLSPKMLDFNKRATIIVNGRRINGNDQKIRPDVKTILEDVRTRGDRQHPFWAKIEGATGRVRGE